ncbi:MAG: mechanosensitive ion channel family protein [Salinigranum sp.]
MWTTVAGALAGTSGVVPGNTLGFAVRLVVFVVLSGIIYAAERIAVEPVLRRLLDSLFDPTLRQTVQQLTRGTVLVLGIVVAFYASGLGTFVDVTGPFVAALTLAVGFASRDTLNNLVSGVFIVADRRFGVGDWIEWNDTTGVIEDISFRVTRVRTFDNELVTVPNSVLATSPVTNAIEPGMLRISTEFRIDIDADVADARRILLDAAAAEEEILEDPAPTVRVVDVNDERMELQSRVWIGDPSRSDFVRVRSEYLTRVKEGFQGAGIDLPPSW